MAEIPAFHKNFNTLRKSDLVGTRRSLACAIPMHCSNVSGSPPSHIQNSQPLRFWFGLSQDECNQPRHIVDMDELYAILQILSSIRQHAREALAFFSHALRTIAAAVRGAAK